MNDAMKGFSSASGRFEVYEELSHLRVYSAHPEYLPVMNLAMRLGEEVQDLETVAEAEFWPAIIRRIAILRGRVTCWRKSSH